MQPIIELTKGELQWWAQIGAARQARALAKGYIRGSDSRDGWLAHIEGALSEIAVAKHINRYISPGMDIFNGPDIGQKYSVRSTYHKHGHLIIYHNDKSKEDNWWFLVIIIYENNRIKFKLPGYIFGKDAMTDRFLNIGTRKFNRNCWAIPQDCLTEFKEENK